MNSKKSVDQIFAFISSINSSWDPKLTVALKKLIVDFEAFGGLSQHFASEFTNINCFHERIWELLIFRKLKAENLQFELGKSGQPDFYISDLNLWIEATAPKPMGIPNYYLETPDEKDIIAYRVPHEEITLRWTAAIDAKNKKLEEYKRKNVVKEDQPYLIAISSCQLGDFPYIEGQSGYPYPIEIAYGIGPHVVEFYKGDPSKDRDYISARDHVYNSKDQPISTKILLDEKYKYVSAILGSVAGLNHVLMNSYEEYVLGHNPSAVNPIKSGLLQNCQEYKARVLGEDDYLVEKIII